MDLLPCLHEVPPIGIGAGKPELINGRYYWRFKIEDQFSWIMDACETEGFEDAIKNYGKAPLIYLATVPQWENLEVLETHGYFVQEAGRIDVTFDMYEKLYNVRADLEHQPILKEKMYSMDPKWKRLYNDLSNACQ